MKINLANIREQGIDFIVFDADAFNTTGAGRSAFLAQLVSKAKRQGLNVDKAALAFMEAGQLKFFGADDLVRFLVSYGLPEWTHELTV